MTQESKEPVKEFRHDFHKLNRLPPYILSVVTDMARVARRAGEDIIDLGDKPFDPDLLIGLSHRD